MFREISEFNLDLCSSDITNSGKKWFTSFAKSLPKEQSEQFLYDFSSFVSSKIKIRIKDKYTNIEYTQYPSNHLKGSKPFEVTDRGKSLSYYLGEFKRIHGNKFDYSGVIYKGAREHITFKCNDCGSSIKMTPDNHRRGKGCKTCDVLNRTLTTEQFIEKAIKIKPDYDYSRVKYVNSKTKVLIGCSNSEHGFFSIKPNNLLNGQGCKKCAIETVSSFNTKDKEHFYKKANPDFLKTFVIEDFEYKGVDQVLRCHCSIHGPFNIQLKYLYRDGWCRSCSKSCSNNERKLFQWVKSKHPNTIQHYRPKWLKLYSSRAPSELDIYIPEVKLAIEYNGTYSHSEGLLLPKNKVNYRQEKYLKCLENDVNLIHIFDFEDLNKWKRKLMKYFENPMRYEVGFINEKKTIKDKFICLGKTLIKEL